VLALTVSLLLQIAAPAVTAVEPPYLVAYRSADLVVRGQGFSTGCRVLLGVPGRMVPVAVDFVDETRLHVELKAGFGPEPATRLLVVDCGAGVRTEPFELVVMRRAPTPAPAEEQVEDEVAAGDGEAAANEPPRALALDPARISAGEPLLLTVTGEDFADGAVVRVLANAAAGTAEPPLYEMVDFPAEYESQRVLLVDFDRGFAPSPRLRRVVVVNPDGASSAPLFLEIVRRSQ
jgi:hypothetical protein